MLECLIGEAKLSMIKGNSARLLEETLNCLYTV